MKRIHSWRQVSLVTDGRGYMTFASGSPDAPACGSFDRYFVEFPSCFL
jgi:hypothetical protein